MMHIDVHNKKMAKTLSPALQKALSYLHDTDFSTFTSGKYKINGEDMFALVMEYDTRAQKKCAWEAHKKYVDVQYVVEGEELVAYAPIDTLEIEKTYDATDDCVLFKGEGSLFHFSAGQCVIFFPKDGHMPGIMIDTPSHVRKITVKVAVDVL